MTANFELLIETEDCSIVEELVTEVGEAIDDIDGVTLKSQSRDTTRNLTGGEIILSYVIGIASGVTIEVVKSIVVSRLESKKLTADVNANEIPPDDVQ